MKIFFSNGMCSILFPSLPSDSFWKIDIYVKTYVLHWSSYDAKIWVDISAWKGLIGWNRSPIRSPEIFLILSPVSGDEKKRRNDKLTTDPFLNVTPKYLLWISVEFGFVVHYNGFSHMLRIKIDAKFKHIVVLQQYQKWLQNSFWKSGRPVNCTLKL